MMKLPKESELSVEQRDICFAKSEGTCLVIGPPGSGKTVVAHFRSQRLRSQKQQVTLMMFNNVLSRYTGDSRTFLSWLYSWWRRATNSNFPKMNWDHHYDAAQEQASQLDWENPDRLQRAHWGHAILDEAQDFHEDAHNLLSWFLNGPFRKHESPPSLMLLADENQRINTENSTIKKIERAHHLIKDNIYELKKNYRNTKEIAQVAAHFWPGTHTGVPELPTKSGNVPTLVRTRNKTEVVERIAKYARLNSQQEIGVLVPYHRTRKRLYKMLEEELGDGHKVQTYTSNRTELENLGMTAQELRDSLTFNKPGVISVLCYASSKGLEFDSVFLPELQTLRVGAENNDTIRMQLYVMCSRARSRLTLMMTEGRGRSPVNDLLPTPPILNEEGE